MGDLERIEGKFLLFLFRNEKNFYTVARFRLKDSSRKVLTVTGYLPDPETGPNYRLEGTYTDHPKYGLQFQIVTYAKMRPDDVEGILYYLSGPKFPGIGAKTAMKLLEDFGKDVMDRIQNDPSCLDNVSYLSEKKKEVLREGLRNSEEEDEQIYRFFTGHKLSMKQIVAIQRIYGAEAIDILKEDPYRMVKDVPGIGFETADEFAMSLGFDAADRKRLCALGAKLLSDAVMSSGSSYLDRAEWESLFARYTSGLEYDPETVFQRMSFERCARFEEDRVYPIAQYEAELTIAMYLKKFPHEPLRKIPSGELEERIARLEETFGIRYDAAQREAIEAFFEEDFMILTGGPGTGKSTIVRAILALIKELYPTSTASVVTPTGRAAKRLKELTDYDARTIHSLLGYDLDTQSFSYNRDNPVLSDIVIADEFSMVDQYLFAKLLDAGAFFR
ncbi:MAG: AAA family ATPase, partial [Erysipelotrichales bacterium]|nr:AAA family ATPase [Erysipelotrichales bacterium]